MSKPDIFMPLYIGDYLAGTSRLTTVQHGAYLLLIMDYWMNGSLPNDDVILSNIARMPMDAWSIHGALLKQFFSIENGMLVHCRIEEELSKAMANKAAAHEKAKKAAGARWKNHQNNDDDATSNASSISQALLKECPSPSPSPSPSYKTNNKQPAVDLPDFIDRELFKEFLTLRTKLKAVNSDRAIKGLITEIEKHSNKNAAVASQIITKSIVNSWKTVYPPSDNVKPYPVVAQKQSGDIPDFPFLSRG